MLSQRYYLRFAAAYVRGKLQEPGPLFDRPLESLDASEQEALFHLGVARKLKLHRFKRSSLLPRVSKVLGHLKGWQPSDILDVGTGRGVFLWPLLDSFPGLPVHCVDLLPYRVEDLHLVHKGGITELSAALQNISQLEIADRSRDLVTFLETLEHIPDPGKALREACRVARRAVILSVPSKADDNPEHIHLFDQQVLQSLFENAGAKSVKFDYVLNHLIAIGQLA